MQCRDAMKLTMLPLADHCERCGDGPCVAGSEPDPLGAQLRGRAQFLEERGEFKSAHLMVRAADEIEGRANRALAEGDEMRSYCLHCRGTETEHKVGCPEVSDKVSSHEDRPEERPRSMLEAEIKLLRHMVKNRDDEIERLRFYVREWENDARERCGVPRQT